MGVDFNVRYVLFLYTLHAYDGHFHCLINADQVL